MSVLICGTQHLLGRPTDTTPSNSRKLLFYLADIFIGAEMLSIGGKRAKYILGCAIVLLALKRIVCPCLCWLNNRTHTGIRKMYESPAIAVTPGSVTERRLGIDALEACCRGGVKDVPLIVYMLVTGASGYICCLVSLIRCCIRM